MSLVVFHKWLSVPAIGYGWVMILDMFFSYLVQYSNCSFLWSGDDHMSFDCGNDRLNGCSRKPLLNSRLNIDRVTTILVSIPSPNSWGHAQTLEILAVKLAVVARSPQYMYIDWTCLFFRHFWQSTFAYNHIHIQEIKPIENKMCFIYTKLQRYKINKVYF